MRRIYWLLILLNFSFSTFSQTCISSLKADVAPCCNFHKSVASDNYIEKVQSQLKLDVSNIDHVHKKAMKEMYTKRAKYLMKLADRGHFYSDSSLQEKINSIGTKLISANSIRENNKIHWVINRTFNPNATCYGEGTIMLNLGLLSQLENLEQVAFVMAHELAHYQLDHVNQKIKNEVEYFNDSSNKKIIKKAAKESRQELLSLLDEKLIDNSKHSRQHELETDAMGYQFYVNAGYTSSQAVRALKILKNIDKGKYPPANYENIFGDLNIDWNEEWLQTKLSGFSLIKATEEEIEIYRTHPKTDLRIEQLLDMGATEEEIKLDEDWCQNTSQIDVELLEYLYWVGDRFGAFVFSMQLFEHNPSNDYVKSILANCLLDFVIAREEYYLSKLVPPPNIKMNDQRFDAATFLDNIDFSDLKQITNQWIEKNIHAEHGRSQSLDSIKLKQNYLNKKDIDEAIEKYIQKFPNSYFIAQIKKNKK